MWEPWFVPAAPCSPYWDARLLTIGWQWEEGLACRPTDGLLLKALAPLFRHVSSATPASHLGALQASERTMRAHGPGPGETAGPTMQCARPWSEASRPQFAEIQGVFHSIRQVCKSNLALCWDSGEHGAINRLRSILIDCRERRCYIGWGKHGWGWG